MKPVMPMDTIAAQITRLQTTVHNSYECHDNAHHFIVIVVTAAPEHRYRRDNAGFARYAQQPQRG